MKRLIVLLTIFLASTICFAASKIAEPTAHFVGVLQHKILLRDLNWLRMGGLILTVIGRKVVDGQ